MMMLVKNILIFYKNRKQTWFYIELIYFWYKYKKTDEPFFIHPVVSLRTFCKLR